MRASEMMNTFFVELKPTDTVLTAARAMQQEAAGIVCICDDQGTPLGVLTDRDIVVRVCAQGKPPEGTSVQAVMSPAPMSCRESDSARDVENVMQERGVGRVLVVDDTGRLAGIISLAEIWHHESPFRAESVSRKVTQRELRMNPTGARLASTPARPDGLAPGPPSSYGFAARSRPR